MRDGICHKIFCLEKYVSRFIEVLEREKFTRAVRLWECSPEKRAGKVHAMRDADTGRAIRDACAWVKSRDALV